jgi:hypothetical protein
MNREGSRAGRVRRFTLAVVAVALSVGLAACGGSSKPTAASPSSAGSASNGPTKIVTFTPPLSNGQPGATNKLKVAILSVKQGKISDFNGMGLDANEKNTTPTYVQVEMTNLGPAALNTTQNDPADDVQGVDDTGNDQDSVSFIGSFPPCPDTDTPNPFPVGKSFQTCLAFLVSGGIKKVAWLGAADVSNPPTWSLP